MTAILSDNHEAVNLAESLWEFFDFQLYCTTRPDDGEPSRIRIDGLNSKEIGDIKVCISLRDTERQKEALVHELLHADLIRDGYPKFGIDEPDDDDKHGFAEDICNYADHLVMKPIYLNFGYEKDRFVRPIGPLTESQKRVFRDLRGMKHDLFTSHGYRARIAAYLQSKSIKFTAMSVADAIAERKRRSVIRH